MTELFLPAPVNVIDLIQLHNREGSNKLKDNITADVVIFGGGLAGISVAYNLSVAGKIAVAIEDGWIDRGETGRTTAQLVTALDDRFMAGKNFRRRRYTPYSGEPYSYHTSCEQIKPMQRQAI